MLQFIMQTHKVLRLLFLQGKNPEKLVKSKSMKTLLHGSSV